MTRVRFSFDRPLVKPADKKTDADAIKRSSALVVASSNNNAAVGIGSRGFSFGRKVDDRSTKNSRSEFSFGASKRKNHIDT